MMQARSGIQKWVPLLLLVIGSPIAAQASAWIGCDACRTEGNWVSPSCSMCGGSTFPSTPVWGMPQVPYCAACMMNAGLYETPAMAPWWMNSAPNYWNFYMPGPYNGLGMMPQYFPPPLYSPQGGHGVYMAKPVVYLRGPEGSKVEMKTVDGKSEVLVAVPSQSHWKAEISGARLKTDEGPYPFFFYDAWVDHEILQDRAGFCGNRAEVLAYMKSSLQEREFPAEAVGDFQSTWTTKLPHQQELCVYPQTEEELNAGVKLQFTPATVKLTQLEFIVVPKKFFKSDEAKSWTRFSKAPVTEAAFRKPASKAVGTKEIRAFDWGVGFLRMSK